jgi:probable addiction module antidote protein
MPMKSYQTDLLVRLADPKYAAEYLKVAFDETLTDSDMAAFSMALKNVVEARDSVSHIAQEAQISRQHLYRLLNGQGNPTLETLMAVLKTVGLSLDFKPIQPVSQA